ncbi:MAG: SDR family NAD(P)-dependent oxidoreductase [Proteobacteria bacterium]|nr:SDR family NAD(P)-dependent oxidoreductase [Pseudomonadota bacterium]
MTSSVSLAIVATACRFPDANSPAELWDNVVEGRRSFRAIPRQRLDLARYAAAAIGEPDSITPVRAGLLTGWRPDPGALRIPRNTFEATDLTHWLALDVARDALTAIGGADRLDRARTAVVVANTLTGEFSRAALLRLRLPFLDDVLAEAAISTELDDGVAARLRQQFAATLRQSFADPSEDSLAGGLANTIAGRIANYFDLHGGGYSVDGACASSLVAVADAGNLLITGQADAVLVAAVDLSLDPFELVGFSRNGALAAGEMRVFDARASGFWPGEGGGAVLLMREEDAKARGLPLLARLRGWGLSSDGAGGLTRPSSDGQSTAYRRAYEMAGIDPADLTFVEAHGTGTAIGDPTEVRALAALRGGAREPLPIGSIKANIGHAKAAAGLAGLIKTVEALRTGIVPPHVGCDTPHGVFAEVDHRVRPVLSPLLLDGDRAALAGVSSFGFGGINAHAVLEATARNSAPRTAPPRPIAQDAELFVFGGETAADVVNTIARLEARAESLSMAELADAATYTADQARFAPVRAAVVARDGSELAIRLVKAKALIAAGATAHDVEAGIFVGVATRTPRIAFLLPGQAAPSRPDGGAWRRRFASSDELVRQLPDDAANPVATDIAQPAITAASLAALSVMQQLGIEGGIATGHSLGEIAALAFAGALDPAEALALARERGAIMMQHGIGGGAMLRLALPRVEAAMLADAHGATVACVNAEREIVLSGSRAAIDAIVVQARARDIETTALKVSHAFHSAHMTPAVEPWRAVLDGTPFKPMTRPVVSTVTGDILDDHAALGALLLRQLTAPVLFGAALDRVAGEADIVVECGPGQGLTRLARARGLDAYSVDAFGPSLAPLLSSVAALFVAGAAPRFGALYAGRRLRAFDPGARPHFLASPCAPRRDVAAAPPTAPEALAVDKAALAPAQEETAVPVLEETAVPARGETAVPARAEAAVPARAEAAVPAHDQHDPLVLVRRAITEETQFAEAAFGDDDRFLDQLHLNSLSVARIVGRAARLAGVSPPRAPTDFANATARELADAIGELTSLGADPSAQHDRIAGVRPWVRRYAMRWQIAPPFEKTTTQPDWQVVHLGDLTSSMTTARGCHVLLWIADGAGEPALSALLTAGQALWRDARVRHLAICHDGLPVSAFARSMAQESRFASVQVVQRAKGLIASDVLPHLGTNGPGFTECRLDASGRRFAPRFMPMTEQPRPAQPIDAGDVVVVTGGSSGIGAECALRLMQCTGAAVALIGRRSADDDGVRQTLERAARMGARCLYRQADVADAAALRAAFTDIARESGSVTVLLHAAGRNYPCAFDKLTVDELRATLAPKTQGLRNALAAAPRLRRVIVFGSIIGRLGLEGEAHYALANAQAAQTVEQWARTRDGARGLAIEWSAWAGLGMGERLGTIERLADRGVTALNVDDALDEFERLVRDDAEGTIAVCGRFGASSHASAEASTLPALRFVGQPLIYYPGTELVVETRLAAARDPYLADHRLDDLAVLPGVIGLEAMAQVAGALAARLEPSAIDNIAFDSAIALPEQDGLTIRIAALVSDDGRVEAAIRAADDDFATIRMRAVFTFDLRPIAPSMRKEAKNDLAAGAALYGSLLFQQGRFQCIAAYQQITARRVVARLDAPTREWFSAFEPPQLVLGNPASQDAMLHALQVAVPHRRVVPRAIERIDIFSDAAIAHIEAIERNATDRDFTFDIDGYGADGRLVRRWRGVTFRAIGSLDIAPMLPACSALLGPYVERIARAALKDSSIEVAIAASPDASRGDRRRAALGALRLARTAPRRDGKPLTDDGSGLSLAHGRGITLAVKTRAEIACDIAEARDFGSGTDPALVHLPEASIESVARLANEPAALATARLWAVHETARKLGGSFEARPKASYDAEFHSVTFDAALARVLTLRCSCDGEDLIVAIGTVPTRPVRPPRKPAVALDQALETGAMP